MNWAQGVKRFFITDDNFARNKDWEAIYDRIIKLREEDGMKNTAQITATRSHSGVNAATMQKADIPR